LKRPLHRPNFRGHRRAAGFAAQRIDIDEAAFADHIRDAQTPAVDFKDQIPRRERFERQKELERRGVVRDHAFLDRAKPSERFFQQLDTG
jgi:hypothetical protein